MSNNNEGCLMTLFVALFVALMLAVVVRAVNAPDADGGNEIASTVRFAVDAEQANKLEAQRQAAALEQRRIEAQAQAQAQAQETARMAKLAELRKVQAQQNTGRWYALMAVVTVVALGYFGKEAISHWSRRPAPVYVSNRYIMLQPTDAQFAALLSDRGGYFADDGTPMLGASVVHQIAKRIDA